jgi:hypothetical protein
LLIIALLKEEKMLNEHHEIAGQARNDRESKR